MVTDAVRDPLAVGLNVTLIEQFAPAATLVPHVVVWEKSLLFAPVTAMELIVSGAFPLLLSATCCAALVVPTACVMNVSEAGARATEGAVVAPVPLRLTV